MLGTSPDGQGLAGGITEHLRGSCWEIRDAGTGYRRELVRAETDHYFGNTVQLGGFGKFFHFREPTPIDEQTVIRMNRDTLYSNGVFDLDAGPVTITLPDAGSRFRLMQVLSEDEYVIDIAYDVGKYTYTREQVGTRYVSPILRTLVDPNLAGDIEAVRALQDATTVDQPGGPGAFVVPDWDTASQKKVRDALLILGTTVPDSRRSFGSKDEVDPIRFVIAAALGWGGNPEKAATYINVVPAQNDGATVHRLTVRDVPVDGFWSISLYNGEGYFEPNPQNAYAVNNLTARKSADGSITVQFGGCDGRTPNCLPIMQGWNYVVRLYRPREEIIQRRWKFPEAAPVETARENAKLEAELSQP